MTAEPADEQEDPGPAYLTVEPGGQDAQVNGGRHSDRPLALSPVVSAQMSRMPRASTGPEVLVRRELHRRGLRFRVDYRVPPARPDLVFTRARIAVFIDGCFWHMCPLHKSLPKNNAEWWLAKLQRNVERDRETDAALSGQGWVVLHFWEHEDPSHVADTIEQRWRELRSTPAAGT